MPFTSKVSPEQWAEAKRMRARGVTYGEIGRHLGVRACTVGERARREAWPSPAPAASREPARAKRGPASPATVGIRGQLALRLYRVIECRIKLMELRMIERLQAHLQTDGHGSEGDGLPAPGNDERESFAALIESINQVTEMASEPAPAADGRRRTATGAIDRELTALSDDIDPDGLAAASEKDALRREIAERLAKIFPAP